MNTSVIHASIEINRVLPELFNHLAGKDLLLVFSNMPYIPRFIVLTNVVGYARPGQECVILFEDNSLARQKFLTFLPEMSFSVRLYNFTLTRL